MDDLIIKWAKEIQTIGQNGLAYTSNVFDKERYERLREIAIEMVDKKSEVDKDIIEDLFASDIGYQTPKLDSRAAIIKEDRILLVRELNNRWSLPGGWVDEDQTIKENTIKEAWEEAGVVVEFNRLIAILDRNRHNKPIYINNITKVFVLCDYKKGSFRENSETLEARWFSLEEVEDLNLDNNKNTLDQVKMCFAAYYDRTWQVLVD